MRIDYWLLMIYPALAVLMLVYGAGIVKSAEQIEGHETLSMKQTGALQAFACIGVILHHITQQITAYGEVDKGPVTLLASMGILFTSVFFFCSGYGLIYSFYNKPGYLKTFLYNRILKVLIPFWSANALFVLINLIQHKRAGSGIQIIKYLSGVTLINSNGWYIIEIVVLYLAFYILFGVIRNADAALGLLCVFTVCLILFAKSRGRDTGLSEGGSWFRGEWWYNSTVVFILGMLIARIGRKAVALVNRYYRLLLVIAVLGFVVIFYGGEKIRRAYGYYRESWVIDGLSSSGITLIWQMALCLVWMCLLVLLCSRVRFGNKVLSFIGSISVELFLTHKLFIDKFFAHTKMSELLRYLVVLVCSVAVAVIMSYVNRALYRLFGYNRHKNIVDVAAGTQNTESEPEDLAAYKKALARASRRKYVVAYTLTGVMVVGLLYGITSRMITQRRDHSVSVSQLKAASIGDVVEFGRFNLNKSSGRERVKWLVIDAIEVDSDSGDAFIAEYGSLGRADAISGRILTLTTTEAIAGETYNHKHEATDWEGSDFRDKLNSKAYIDMFNKYDKEMLLPDEYGDLISIMSVSEAEKYFPDDEARKLTGCETAVASGLNINNLSKVNQWDYKQIKTSWWWLRPDGAASDITAPVVSVEGSIELHDKFVNKPNGGVRPVVRVLISE